MIDLNEILQTYIDCIDFCKEKKYSWERMQELFPLVVKIKYGGKNV